MITADQLLAHAVGDYLLQSDWMAQQKTKRVTVALVHALAYALPFLLLTTSPAALAVIVVTHAAIDRWRIARFVVYAKNFLAPPAVDTDIPDAEALKIVARNPLMAGLVPMFRRERYWHPWKECSATGYHKDRPPFLAVWLLIIADNVMHVLINGAAIRWLG